MDEQSLSHNDVGHGNCEGGPMVDEEEPSEYQPEVLDEEVDEFTVSTTLSVQFGYIE